jgi:hypothetical protein
MKTEQSLWRAAENPSAATPLQLADAQLVFLFGPPDLLNSAAMMGRVCDAYPKAIPIGCSTAGEIQDLGVSDDALVATAIKFASTQIEVYTADLAGEAESSAAGKHLAEQIATAGLRHVFVLSEGVAVNGTLLTQAITENLPPGTLVTGGLAADGDKFGKTYVLVGRSAREKTVTALAFYGENLVVQSGSFGGWDPFGPERIVTRAVGPVVYELDGKPVLELYKTYLGSFAQELPGSALLFPLSVRIPQSDEFLVRTVLGVDEATGSMRFAGDIAEGARARLMKANYNRLLDGAGKAASFAARDLPELPVFALLVSCVGRRLVLKKRIDEEIDAVRAILGKHACLAGFYSYGEIAPVNGFMECNLHNQTMTITTYCETR